MATITHDWTDFIINEDINLKYSELVKLILETESMENDEKQYWFDIMPSMTDDQIDRLFNILDTERKKLEALEAKYKTEIKELNEKHLIEWQEFQLKDSKQKIAEAQAKDKDEEDAEDVLRMLNEL